MTLQQVSHLHLQPQIFNLAHSNGHDVVVNGEGLGAPMVVELEEEVGEEEDLVLGGCVAVALSEQFNADNTDNKGSSPGVMWSGVGNVHIQR